jgi:hypothetical protein
MKRFLSYFLLVFGVLFRVNGFGQSEVEWVVEPSLEFDDVKEFSEGLALVKKNEKYGYVNTLGQLVTELGFDYVGMGFSEGLLKVSKNHKSGFIDKNGKIVIPFIDSGFIPDNFSNGLALIVKGGGFGKYGFIDKTGKEVIPCIYDYNYQYEIERDFDKGLARVKKNGKWGFIDITGKEVIPCIYDAIQMADTESPLRSVYFSEGLVKVKKNGKWGVIDLQGKEVIPFIYNRSHGYGGDDIYHDNYCNHFFSEGLVAVNKNGKDGFIDKRGKVIIPFIYDYVGGFFEGLSVVKKNEKYGFIDKRGKVIIPFIYDNAWNFSEGLVRVKKNEKYLLIDKRGKVIIPFIYDYIVGFSEGLIIVKKNGKYGYTNTSGKLVTQIEFDKACNFSEGLALVKKNGKYGYINTTGKLVTQIEFDKASSFSQGLANVKKNGKWGIIRHLTKPIINFPNLPKTITLTDALKLDIKICITSPNEQTVTKLYINDKAQTSRGFGKGKDSDVCDEIYTYKLTLPRNGDYEIKVIASNQYGTTTTSRLVQVVNNFDKSVRLPKGKNHAVIIGIEDYENWTDLSTPLNDCRALAKVLVDSYNFDTDNVHTFYNEDATRSRILHFLERLSEKIAPNDNLLVYYAGHGYYDKDSDTGYWIPVDAPKGKAHWDFIKDKDIKAVLCASISQNTYVIADACYSGSFFDKYKTRTDPLPDDMTIFVNTLQQKTSFRGFASGQLEEVGDVSIRNAKHSPFADALLQVLAEWTYPALPATFLENAVLMKVQPTTNQTPNANYVETCDDNKGKNNGQFVFYREN